MLDKAHLSPDDKAKTKALLDLHNAIQESEDNEEGGSDPPPRYIRPLCSERSKLRNINAVLEAFCEARMSKRQRKNSRENNQRLINTCQPDQYQITAPHGQDANNTKVTNCYSDRYYGNWE